MNKEPSVLTRMRLSGCWGDNLNEKELNEVVDYINHLQQENKQLKDNWNELKDYFTNITNYSPIDDNPLCEILIMTYEDINNKMQELEKGE